jgi:hypothetical protein
MRMRWGKLSPEYQGRIEQSGACAAWRGQHHECPLGEVGKITLPLSSLPLTSYWAPTGQAQSEEAQGCGSHDDHFTHRERTQRDTGPKLPADPGKPLALCLPQFPYLLYG